MWREFKVGAFLTVSLNVDEYVTAVANRIYTKTIYYILNLIKELNQGGNHPNI